VGYAKSASTTLQKQLFNQHPEINNLGLFPTQNIGQDSDYIDESCLFLKDENLQKFYYNLVMLNSIDYLNSNNIDIFNQNIKKYISNTKINLFSNERLTSVFFSHDDIVSKADRLKKIFPNAKIIVIIRNQFNLIKSQYRDHPFNPKELSIGKPVSLNDWIKIAFESEGVYFLNSLKYGETIDYYEKLFGKENIQILLLEELASDINLFSEKISQFMDIDYKNTLNCLLDKRENTSVSKKYNFYRRIRRKIPFQLEISKFFPGIIKNKLLNKLKSGKKEEFQINKYWVKQLEEYYSDSNKKLEKKYDLNLKKYNYPMTK
jgi:hypothetical protein